MNADYPSTKSQPKLTAADYHGTSIQLIEKDGSRWLTARDLGLCLGYNEANARQGILNLYNRHVDEFTEKDSVVIKLISTDGKAYDTRIFSPSGCHLLSFFASTTRAKDFRAWAKEVLVQAGARKFPPTPCLRRLFVHNEQQGLKSPYNERHHRRDCGFFMPAVWRKKEINVYGGGAANTTPSGNKLGRFVTSFEPPPPLSKGFPQKE